MFPSEVNSLLVNSMVLLSKYTFHYLILNWNMFRVYLNWPDSKVRWRKENMREGAEASEQRLMLNRLFNWKKRFPSEIKCISREQNRKVLGPFVFLTWGVCASFYANNGKFCRGINEGNCPGVKNDCAAYSTFFDCLPSFSRVFCFFWSEEYVSPQFAVPRSQRIKCERQISWKNSTNLYNVSRKELYLYKKQFILKICPVRTVWVCYCKKCSIALVSTTCTRYFPLYSSLRWY